MDSFDLPVNYNGKEYSFPTQIIKQIYSQKFEVLIDGHPIYFEPDEEGIYRAVVSENDTKQKLNDLGLLKEIAEALQYLVG